MVSPITVLQWDQMATSGVSPRKEFSASIPKPAAWSWRYKHRSPWRPALLCSTAASIMVPARPYTDITFQGAQRPALKFPAASLDLGIVVYKDALAHRACSDPNMLAGCRAVHLSPYSRLVHV